MLDSNVCCMSRTTCLLSNCSLTEASDNLSWPHEAYCDKRTDTLAPLFQRTLKGNCRIMVGLTNLAGRHTHRVDFMSFWRLAQGRAALHTADTANVQFMDQELSSATSARIARLA